MNSEKQNFDRLLSRLSRGEELGTGGGLPLLQSAVKLLQYLKDTISRCATMSTGQTLVSLVKWGLERRSRRSEVKSTLSGYQKALEDADAKQISTLVFPSLPLAKQASRMFPAINALYKLMRDFQDSHAHPEEILICCEDDQVLNLYMVVWNMYYAADKPSRMNDGRWD